jgi:hypothetical protein
MVSSVTGSAGFSTAMLSGSQCRGPRGSESQQADKAALQEKLFGKLDVNGDGGVDESELNDFLSYAASATGSTSATRSADLFKTIDSDGDGSISKTEMADGAKSLFDELRTQLRPPPSGGPGGGGRFSMIQSLLDQYRSTSTDATTEATTSSLSIAA